MEVAHPQSGSLSTRLLKLNYQESLQAKFEQISNQTVQLLFLEELETQTPNANKRSVQNSMSRNSDLLAAMRAAGS